jgi:transposase
MLDGSNGQCIVTDYTIASVSNDVGAAPAVQLILAMVVTEEGLPLSYEVFDGNRADVTTLEEILDSVERKHGKLGRVWVFERGIVSEENLNLLRSRGASYLMATPKRLLTQFQKELLAENWTQVAKPPADPG